MVKSFEELVTAHSRALEGGEPMAPDAVRAQLVELPQWASDGKRLARTYAFGNYWEVIAFVNAIAYTVHHEDHHPEMVVGYDRVEVRFDTHSVGGISVNDFIGAAKCDAAYGIRPRLPTPAAR